MIRRAWNWLAARFASHEDDDASDDARFVPSVLDASVRYAHGDGNNGLDREIAQLQEKGRRLERQRRDE